MRPRLVVASTAGAVAVLAANASPSAVLFAPLGIRVAPALVGVGRPGHVALTFDDGPDPASTPAFLEALTRAGVHATFFVLGSMAARAPSLVAEIVAGGHEVGVHGYAHRSVAWRRPAALGEDVARARDLVEDAGNQRVRWFRPPYGNTTLVSLGVARRLGLQTVLWTAWGRDWRDTASPASVVADVERGRLNGGTILLHDSDCTSAPFAWQSALGALAPLLARLSSAGLTVGPLGDHGLPRRAPPGSP